MMMIFGLDVGAVPALPAFNPPHFSAFPQTLNDGFEMGNFFLLR